VDADSDYAEVVDGRNADIELDCTVVGGGRSRRTQSLTVDSLPRRQQSSDQLDGELLRFLALLVCISKFIKFEKRIFIFPTFLLVKTLRTGQKRDNIA